MEMKGEEIYTQKDVSGDFVLPMENSSPPAFTSELQLNEGFLVTLLLSLASRALFCQEVKDSQAFLPAASGPHLCAFTWGSANSHFW